MMPQDVPEVVTIYGVYEVEHEIAIVLEVH